MPYNLIFFDTVGGFSDHQNMITCDDEDDCNGHSGDGSGDGLDQDNEVGPTQKSIYDPEPEGTESSKWMLNKVDWVVKCYNFTFSIATSCFSFVI